MTIEMTTYSSTPQRVLVDAAKEMLAQAQTVSVLDAFGSHKEQPLRRTDTISWRRLNTFNMKANGTPDINPGSFRLEEGVNPPSYGHSYTDVVAVLKEYGYVEKFSSKAAEMYADDIPGDARVMVGNVMAEITELIRYGVIKAGSVVEYANGTTRVGINTKITLNSIRRAVRTLRNARAMMVTSRLSASEKFGTSPVKPGFIGFCHTDMIPDIRDLPGFISAEEYGSATSLVHPAEFGACEDVRFLASPLFAPFLAAGAAVGATGLKAENATNIDVYPLVITAADAWGQVALKGARSIRPILIPAEPSASNPLGMYGYVGAKIWMEAVRLNENFMVRVEAGVSNLA